LDSRTAGGQAAQASTITSVLNVLQLRAASLGQAAQEVLDRPAPRDITYTPVSTADAVILYARNFMPSWAGAIAIDLLPGVLVLILMVTHGAIREGRGDVPAEDTLTLAELRAALHAIRDVEDAMRPAPRAAPVDAPNVQPLTRAQRDD
jgi:hypothetical protein